MAGVLGAAPARKKHVDKSVVVADAKTYSHTRTHGRHTENSLKKMCVQRGSWLCPSCHTSMTGLVPRHQSLANTCRNKECEGRLLAMTQRRHAFYHQDVTSLNTKPGTAQCDRVVVAVQVRRVIGAFSREFTGVWTNVFRTRCKEIQEAHWRVTRLVVSNGLAYEHHDLRLMNWSDWDRVLLNRQAKGVDGVRTAEASELRR